MKQLLNKFYTKKNYKILISSHLSQGLTVYMIQINHLKCKKYDNYKFNFYFAFYNFYLYNYCLRKKSKETIELLYINQILN